MFESDTDREAILRGLGGASVAGPQGQFTGVLEMDYIPVGDAPIVESSAPRLTVRTSDAKRCGVDHGTVLLIEDESYVVRGVQPDGTGMTVLILEGP